jgi:ribosomal protein S18 acetylase RimI-like enzyme
MRAICLHDQHTIAAALRRDLPLHLYTLGDLDPFFWPHTSWYAAEEHGEIHAVLLLYTATATPTLLALGAERDEALAWLLGESLRLLPRRLYAHLSPGLLASLADVYEAEGHGRHYKLMLRDPGRMAALDTSATLRLRQDDLPEVTALYAAAYPGNWFDPRMLETGHYYGLRENGRLASIAGVHVFSPQYRVAAIGNVTTLPAYRGRGLASRVMARLCAELAREVDHIGLNVAAANQAAVACYERLGFALAAEYDEVGLAARC